MNGLPSMPPDLGMREQLVYLCLAGSHEGMTTQEIMEVTHATYFAVTKAFSRLRRAGVAIGRSGHAYFLDRGVKPKPKWNRRRPYEGQGNLPLEPDPNERPFTHRLWELSHSRKVYWSQISAEMGFSHSRVGDQVSRATRGEWTWQWAFARSLIRHLVKTRPALVNERELTILLARELGDTALEALLEPTVVEKIVEPKPFKYRPTDWSHEPAFTGVSSALG